MKKISYITAAMLSLVLVMTATGCDESASPATSDGSPLDSPAATTTMTTADPDENAATDKDAKEIESADYVPDGNAGTVSYLCHYDFAGDQKSEEEYLVFTSEQYGGTFNYINCSYNEMNDKMATLIASDDSPDIVLYMWQSFPGMASKNMYEALDDHIDYSTELWSEMKDKIESFTYKGKHYYFPHRNQTHFALNYNRKTIEEYSLADPYQLYLEGNWTWDTWRELMVEFCNQDEENIGFGSAGDVVSAFVSTTGVPIVDMQPDGTIVNNSDHPDITRAMLFVEDLYRSGLTHRKQLGDWVSPELWAVNSDRMLFIGMEPEWCYTAATGQIQDPRGTENDIFDTPSDFAIVPFPRDPQADKYYQASDTFGYLVPKGAKNIKGAVDWIYCNRVYAADENVKAQVKEDHINPAVVTYVDGKFAGQRKWQIMWDESSYDMLTELRDPSKFSFVFDDVYGFNNELSNDIVGNMLNEVAYNGGSWTQLSNENKPLIDAVVDKYRQ